jgi:hypothetical protein
MGNASIHEGFARARELGRGLEVNGRKRRCGAGAATMGYIAHRRWLLVGRHWQWVERRWRLNSGHDMVTAVKEA